MGVLDEVQLTLVDSYDDVADLFRWLGESRPVLAVDIETTGVNLGRDRVRLTQLGDADRAWAFPSEGNRSYYGAFTEALERYRGQLVAHNAIFEASFLKREGVPLDPSRLDDTMVLAQLNQSAYGVGLKPLADRFVDRTASVAQDLLSESMKKQGWDWSTVPTDFPNYWVYGALDCVLTARLHEKLVRNADRYSRSYEIEMGAIDVLKDAQLRGMKVDVDYCRRKGQELEAEMAALEPSLPCNPNAPAQVVEFLQSRGCELTKETESGALAADDEVLEYWAKRGVPECGWMQRYREARKLKSSYFDNLLGLEDDGVVHPSIRVLGAQKTGRMSVTAPALQTLPKSAVGRDAFVARDGHCLILADFAGIEMRLLAHLAHEEQMVERYREGVDLHTWTAQQIFRTDEPTDQMRDVAKRSGFAKIYGAGVEKFALSTGLKVHEAQQFLERYDELFPGVTRFQESVVAEVKASAGRKKWGHVHTEFGRKLMVPSDAAYKGVNYRDQGTAGEVLKLKLCELANAGLGENVLLPIHDEIVFEVPLDQLDDAVQTVREVMPERDLFEVPLEVDVKTTGRWGDVYR